MIHSQFKLALLLMEKRRAGSERTNNIMLLELSGE